MSSLNGDLEGVIENLRRLHWAAENRVSEAQAILDQAKAERDHIGRMLKVAGVQEEQAKPKPKAKEKPASVNATTRAEVIAGIRRWRASGASSLPEVSGSFTALDISGVVSVHSSSVRTAIHNLRDEGIIRAIGLKPGTPRRAPMVYVLGEGNEASV
jgi:hypothetical protein